VSERHEEIARFVQRSQALRPLFLRLDLAPPFREPYPAADQVAEELLAESEFKALRLATLLRSPDGELIADAVELILPPVYRSEFELAVEAMQLAADMQYEEGASQRLAGGFALLVGGVFGVSALAPALRRGLPVPAGA
jgi:hypothetical protein